MRVTSPIPDAPQSNTAKEASSILPLANAAYKQTASTPRPRVLPIDDAIFELKIVCDHETSP
jgi:hypothetical protein